MSMRPVLWLLAAALALVPSRPEAAPDTVVVEIKAGGLVPRVAQATTAQRVLFVNRTGRIVHVQFQGKDGAQHHVYQVRGDIWAVFHAPGPHLYVVHFESGPHRALRGLVEVGHVPGAEVEWPTCGSVTVRGDCLDP